MIDASVNPNIEHIALRLKTIPESPGVYQHLDADGKVIYVGKARNLQRRVSSYFSHYDDKSAKIKMLVRSVRDIRVTVVATEVDALLLENSLIKRYQPRYNSMLKDDKTYPYLCITDEEYPRLLYTRRHTVKGQYFGPYPDGRILRQLQDIIRQLFQYRTCDHMGKRPCMKHQIGLCGAPCAGKQSREEYLATFDNIRRILRGDFGEIVDQLKQQMYSLADQLRFEEAEAVKHKIRQLEEYQSRSTVVDTNVRDVDVVAILGDESYAWVSFLRVKHGAIIYSISNEIKKQLDESEAEIMATAVPALHEQSQSTATEVILPFAIPDLPADAVVQVSSFVGGAGAQPVAFGPLPASARGYLQLMWNMQRLVEEAAVTGDYGALMEAVALNPQTPAGTTAQRVIDELLVAHKAFLPQFANKIAELEAAGITIKDDTVRDLCAQGL